MNSELKPKIRFKGFTDDWKQRKAKELCSISTGKSNTQDQVENGLYPFYIRSDIPVRSNRYLYDEEAVITIGDGNIGKVFHYVNGKFDLHQRCYKMDNFKDLEGKYFYYFFSTKFYDRAMSMTAKATVDSVRLEMISDMNINYPSDIKEQREIGSILTNLDNLITLHQRKCDKLVEIKKSLLEKMFPQNNSVIPEIRFKGFTDDWEQRKLNQFSKYITSNKTVSDIVIDGKYDLYDANSIIGKINKDVIKEEYITIIKDGSGVGKVRRLPKNTLFIGTMGGIISMNSNIDFLYCNLLKTDFTKEVNGATIPHVYYSSYGNNEYYIPAVEEQNKIGMIFNNLDNLITLHQRKHDKLNKIKQSLLNDMFV